ncbi:hypothetical protein [Nocardioides sp.]|uniref:hypothetical protein n=1 Tax=Nocardioides sp. TaxID=35761 RepID=UPI002733031F|nr:hypothetical protein [Nocardioides sp.]MDP3894883.1 hypothetical protein [Nocardioides sp.]
MSEHDDEAAATEQAPPTDIRESDANASGPQGLAGGMGVSSERVGPVGDEGTEATHGVRPSDPVPTAADEPPEQAPGHPEENPVGIPPKPHHPEHNPGHGV